jgi:seryl-tRNA synthetase
LAKEFFENGAAAFTHESSREQQAAQRRIASLEEKLKKKNEVLSELMEEHVQLKRSCGALEAAWVPHDKRDAVIDFVRRWSERAEISAKCFISWIGIAKGKYHDRRLCYGRVNEHKSWIPRDWWLEEWEKQAMVDFRAQYPMEGYRRLEFMMLDADVVHVSLSWFSEISAARSVTGTNH